MQASKLSVLLAAVSLGLFSCGGGDDDRLNVLLVTLDTTRADALGVYGNPRPTPAIDGLASEGWTFETAYSTAAVTPVSHASMLTGLNPYRHGLRVLYADGGYRLERDVPSLATRLAAEGWSTAAVHSAFPVSAVFGLDQGFEVFESFDTEFQSRKGKQTWSVSQNQRRSDDTTDIVLDVLGSAEKPFFLWLHYWDPHDSQIKPPQEYWPKPGSPQPFVDGYMAEVAYMDTQLGRVFDALRESGQWERTLVVLTADHGEGLGEHGWLFHRLLYDEQIRVPLVVRIPGEVPSRVSHLASHIDIVPTVLSALGLAGGDELDGVDLRGVVAGNAGERFAYADQINNYDTNSSVGSKRTDDGFLYSVTDGRWKLIYKPLAPQRSELYDLRADPHEGLNQFGTAQNQRDRLLMELAARRSWVTAPFTGAGANAETSAALQDLGYTEGEIDTAEWVFGCIDHGPVEDGVPGATCEREVVSGSAERTCRLPLLLMKR